MSVVAISARTLLQHDDPLVFDPQLGHPVWQLERFGDIDSVRVLLTPRVVPHKLRKTRTMASGRLR